ncbi:MAG: hypothetical protein EHM33_20335 [Chloroflexi bacterium]|nr:MAG: hypothetical protein EHM33_20335 [Chloroflexota bacterium]
MQIKSFHHTLPYFFTQRIPGQDPDHLIELAGSDPELERNKGVLENILRWEDDGGQIIEINHSTLDRKRKKHNA